MVSWFSEMFGETVLQRVFWISLYVVGFSLMIFGVWLFGEMIDELGRLLND